MKSPPAATGPRRCPQCGSDVPPGFRFCGACGCRMDEVSQPAIAPVRGAPAARPAPRAIMTLIRPDGSEGGTHELRQGDNKIGRNFGPVFETDGYLSPVHAEILVNGTAALVRDLESLNGVFVKMTEEEELTSGQIIRIGQELLRFELFVRRRLALARTFDENEIDRAFYLLRNRLQAPVAGHRLLVAQLGVQQEIRRRERQAALAADRARLEQFEVALLVLFELDRLLPEERLVAGSIQADHHPSCPPESRRRLADRRTFVNFRVL